MHCSDAALNYAPNPAFLTGYVTCITLHALGACKLMAKISFMTPRTCEEQSFYGKRCFNPCCLNVLDLGRDETSYMSTRSLICTRSAGYICQSQKYCVICWTRLSQFKIHTAHNKYSSYCKSHVSSGSWKNQSCTSHGAVMEGKGSTVRFPGTTLSKRSRSCRQGLEALQKTDVNRTILPKILRAHSWSNSFQASVVWADTIQREPNRLQSSQSGSKERKAQAPENLRLPNYQSNLILVQNYIFLH